MFNEFPNNAFLQKSISKSLYALAKYKNIDQFHLATKSYSKVEGEAQQVYYLFRRLNSRQINTIALHNLYNTIQANPKDTFLIDLFNDLVADNVVKEVLNFDSFLDIDKKPTISGDFYQVLDHTKDKKQIVLLQRKYKYFYLHAFDKKDIESTLFTSAIQAGFEKKKEAKKDYYEKKAHLLKLIKNRNIVVLNPENIYINKGKIDLNISSNNSEKIIRSIQSLNVGANKNRIQIESLQALANDDVNQLNKVSSMIGWVNEKRYLKSNSIIPLSSDQIKNIKGFNNNSIVMDITSLSYKKKSFFEFSFYDIKEKKTLGKIRLDLKKGDFNEKHLNKELIEIFKQS